MALTLRTNGSGSSNLIQAAWFNDFYNLFTGSMQDQPITFKHNQTLQAIGTTPNAPIAVIASGSGGLSVGSYTYAVSFVSSDGGCTVPGITASVTTTSGNQNCNLSSIPTGPTGTTARYVWRSKVGGGTLYRLTTLNNNTSTTYVDSVADTSLTIAAPSHSSFGGTLNLKDGNGNVNFVAYNDSTLVFDNVSLQGETAGSISIGVAQGGTNPDLVFTNAGQGFITFRSKAKFVSFRDETNTAFGNIYNTSNLLVIQNANNNSPIGFRNGNFKLAEMRGDGTFIILGTTYYSNQTSVGTAANGTFDGFDFSECYQMDQEYTSGTVVCPADTYTSIAVDTPNQQALPIMTKCTHDACNLAGVIVTTPAFCAGAPNRPSGQEYDATKPLTQPVAQSGRVFARTAYDISGRQYVCSDGRGGVRAVQPGESVLAIGIALSPTTNGMVPILVRPVFVML